MKIACKLNKGLTRTDACGYSLKQINDIYLANYGDIKASDITFGTGETANDEYEVKTITGTAKWYHIEPAKDTSSYNDDLVIGGNGSKYRTHTMTFSFAGAYGIDLAKFIDEISLGKYVAVLKLSDGTGVMLGRLTGMEASAASSLSEAAADGQNGLTVTLECNTTEPALVMSAAALATVVASEEAA